MKESLRRKDISPNESVSLIRDTTKKTTFWRHKYATLQRRKIITHLEEYDREKFKSIDEFYKHVIAKEKHKEHYK